MNTKMWNERFQQAEYIYGEAPNDFLANELAKLPPGKLLLPCEGEGRNAVYAAKLGWTVDAFDFAEQGLQKAEQLARKHNVSFNNFWVTEAESFRPEQATYDAVGLAYCHIAPESRYAFHQRLVSSLSPGGTVIFEAFAEDQLAYNSGGPPVKERLFTAEAVQHEFKGLNFPVLEHQIIHLQEGRYHSGAGAVIRMVGQKPA